MSRFSDETALYYFNRGVSTAAYLELGCHEGVGEYGERVYRFSVWAPNAEFVSVVGGFNFWNIEADRMERVGTTGVWEIAIGVARPGDLYKYAIGTYTGEVIMKADPFAFRAELHGTASVVGDMPYYDWTDEEYLDCRDDGGAGHDQPMNIYEVHLGSWKQGLGYRELADELIDYVAEMGYTHIEVMPLMEYPYDPSWGYQVTGYYAATARYGEPEELMYLVDRAHSQGISVIMDWVPAHFTRDAHGLRLFDGTPLFEHPDPRRGEMPQWGTLLFNFERSQVQSFLISSAMYWLREFHFDGLRVDAVSAMLYLDFGKQPGEWLPNRYGGHDNLDAVAFFRKLNSAIGKLDGGKMLFAEESSAYPYVTRPVSEDGLGFAYKWNMGWMNDMLTYMSMDSIYRKYHHDKLTFSLCYAFSEHYVLPFSHDEVVHGKKSMLSKMPGDYWQQFAQLRLLYAYQYAHPGKKLMFMGGEFGQYIEWKFDDSLDWFLLDYPKHAEMHLFVHDLNHFYLDHPPLYETDDSWEGFRWCGVDDNIHSILSFMRTDRDGNSLLWTFNFTPMPWMDYMIGVPRYGLYTEVFSTDAPYYGGTGDYPNAPTMSVYEPYGEHPCRIRLRLPPFGAVCYRFTPKPLPKFEAKQEDDA
ncbi:MAG: 1,4-alpha-glucan branching protein GlgB [Clostridiales bacterium]|nr:1,4-alpha-glucan branching protein GlgB [Clostridiales bacterium]